MSLIYVGVAYDLFCQRWSPRVSWRCKPTTKEEEEERRKIAAAAITSAANSCVYRWMPFVAWLLIGGGVIAFTVSNRIRNEERAEPVRPVNAATRRD